MTQAAAEIGMRISRTPSLGPPVKLGLSALVWRGSDGVVVGPSDDDDVVVHVGVDVVVEMMNVVDVASERSAVEVYDVLAPVSDMAPKCKMCQVSSSFGIMLLSCAWIEMADLTC